MTVTSGQIGPLRRGLSGLLAGGLLSAMASVLIALPMANAAPQQPCNKTVGESVDSYLNQHPDVKQDLTRKGQQESPGSTNPLGDYLNRHPDVRQHLVTLSQQCVP